MKNTENRPLEVIEFEFVGALSAEDNESILDLLNERADIPVFFCSVAILNNGKEALRAVMDDITDENVKAIVRRMTSTDGRKGFSLMRDDIVRIVFDKGMVK